VSSPEIGNEAQGRRRRITEDDTALSRRLAGLGSLLVRPPWTVACWVLAIVSLGVLALHLPERVGREDFSCYYASAWTLRSGGDPYVQDLDPAAKRFGLHLGLLKRAVYTPTFMLSFEPMTFLRPRTAYWIWQALNAIALCVAMIMLLGDMSRRHALVVAPLMLAYPPVADHFAYAQCQFLLLLMLVIMLRWIEQGRDASAGLMLALAGLLRAFPLALAGYLVLRRRWTACLWCGVGLAAGAAVTYAMVGPRCFDFIYGVRWANGFEFLALPVFVSVVAVSSQLFWYSLGPNISPILDHARVVFGFAAQLTIVAFTVRATLAMHGRADRDGRLFSLWIATAMLISPNAQMHYLVLLFIPFAQFAAATGGDVSGRATAALVASYILSLVSCAGMSCLTILGSPQVQSLGRGPAWRVLDFSGWMILAKEECAFLALLLAYIAIYWFVSDCRNTLDSGAQVKLARSVPYDPRGSTLSGTHALREACR
jgi:Glycosyltransferase family 87